jgi:hypothetical protein
MGSYSTPSGDLFAVDDRELDDLVRTLGAHIVAGDRMAALKVIADTYESTNSLDYLTLVCQEATTRALVYLVNTATPGETIGASTTLGAVIHSVRSLTAVRSP